MSDIPQADLIDALRRLGVTIPDAKPITLRDVSATVDNRIYWHVYCGAFDTYIDPRDASTADEALKAACEPLQPWYVRKISFAETPTVEQASRKEYLEWLTKGTK
jgi:hypothetical protein